MCYRLVQAELIKESSDRVTQEVVGEICDVTLTGEIHKLAQEVYQSEVDFLVEFLYVLGIQMA